MRISRVVLTDWRWPLLQVLECRNSDACDCKVSEFGG